MREGEGGEQVGRGRERGRSGENCKVDLEDVIMNADQT